MKSSAVRTQIEEVGILPSVRVASADLAPVSYTHLQLEATLEAQ